MSTVADDLVVQLRTVFIKRAVMRVRELAMHGDIEEALVRASALARYFEWVREDILPEERQLLVDEIHTLPSKLNVTDL